MGLFKKHQPLDALHHDPTTDLATSGAQDNVLGPDSLDYEAIEHAEAKREEEKYLVRGSGLRFIGSAGQLEAALRNIPRPVEDPKDD